MKSTVESSVISRSQSEINSEAGKSNLIHGTTTKLDSLFHVYDQICNKSNLPSFVYIISAIYLYFQVFFLSLYPFNKYWIIVNENRERCGINSKIIQIFSILEQISWFFRVEDRKYDSSLKETNGQTDLMIPAILICCVFCYSILSISAEMLGAFQFHTIKKLSFYNLRAGFTLAAPLMLLPIAAFFGTSIRNLALGSSKLNIFYLFFGCALYLICMAYSYLGQIFLNQSTNFSITCLSSFGMKIPILLTTVSSITIICECILSIFDNWTTIIIQLAHIVVSGLALYQVVYLVYHSKLGNVLIIGIILSTWFNDLIFVFLYFIEPPSKFIDGFSFYYSAGLILPFFSLIISLIIAYFYVTIRTNIVLKELIKLSDEIESFDNDNDNNNSSEENLLIGHKLFKNEKMALMSIHLSFLHCLPLFYKLTAINYTASVFPSTDALMQIVHYLSFFPGASRKMNTFLSAVSKCRDLNYHQRFLLFQIYHIKTTRQSSVSPDSNRLLADLKNLTIQVYEDIYSFWNCKSTTLHYLEMISTENFKVDNKWDEAIREYPNHPKITEEYCTYLAECQMDIKRALVMKHRSNLMEMGRNFNIDVPFISLARNLPNYLEYEIVDYQGNFKNKQKDSHNSNANETSTAKISSSSAIKSNSTGTGSMDSGSSNSSMLSNYNLDPDFEETIGRQLFKQAALRLEMNRSLSNRHSYVSNLFLIAALVILTVGFAVFTFIYVFINAYITDKMDSMYYLNLASKARFYLDLSILGTTLKFAYHTNRFTSLDKFNSLDYKDDQIKKANGDNDYDPDIFYINDDISENFIHRNIVNCRNSFNQLMFDLSIKGQDLDENVYEFAYIMMFKLVPQYSCFDGVPGQPRYLSLKELYSYMYYIVEQSAARKVDEGTWFNSDEICEIFSNQPGLETSTLQLFQTLMQNEIDLCENEAKTINLFSFIFPFIPFILFLLPEIIFIKLFINDSNKIINILLNVNQEAKEIAKMPILKDSSIEVVQPTEKKAKNTKLIILIVVILVLCAVSAIIIYFMLDETRELNGDIKKIGRWNLLASIRMANSVETLSYLLTAVILNGSNTLNLPSSPNLSLTRSNMIRLCKESKIKLYDSNEALLKGNEIVGPSSGFDDELDKINTDLSCEIIKNNNSTDIHENYRCSSASQGVGIFITMIDTIIDEIESTGGNFDNEMIYHSLHLLNRHLLERLEQAVDRINTINVLICQKLNTKLIATFICGMIISFITFIVALILYAKSIYIYKVAMALAQRLPPATFFSDKKLHNFILNRKELKEENEMSTSQSVIFMSLDAIICTNASGDVEIINPAVTEILGYTPEQMLGQNISAFFVASNEEEEQQQNKQDQEENPEENEEKPEENEEKHTSNDSERILNQLEMMKNGQSSLIYEDHFRCLTDDEKIMPCGITILAMTGKDSNNIESFVVILRDETQLMQQQKEAEAAKAQSENLLFHILPRDIVTRINSGEKDISFTVQSATIIFTDIVKFSEYASNLSPQEIMGSLSTMFAAFDLCAKKYDLITKIKLIGDIYMAAGGLFADENTIPKDHALQILKFGIDCLIELEDVNIKLNSNLSLRVGVNTGGPLLAGVLGTDKPVFDIIGDPINVAARLQTTDLPGKVQIPKSTYDLVCDDDFQIEERGEVFLKGKGKTMAYLVSPYSINNNAIEMYSSVPND